MNADCNPDYMRSNPDWDPDYVSSANRLLYWHMLLFSATI